MSLEGVLSGKVGTGMCGPDRAPFRPLGFTNGLFFYLKIIGLDKGRVFAKCLIFDEFSSGLPLGCQKVPMHGGHSTFCVGVCGGGVGVDVCHAGFKM